MPIQHSPYGVRFVCDANEKKEFAGSHCLVAISIENPLKNDGEKFASLLRKINDSFSQCTILLCDSLHRHIFNILDENACNDEVYYTRALRSGDAWLERNCHAVDALAIPHTIMRWDEWREHANFKAMKNLIDELYNQNPTFRMAMLESVKEYLLRVDKKFKPVNCTNAYKQSAEYLKEQCAAMQLMAPTYNYLLYSAVKRPAVIQMIYDHLIKPHYPNSMKWVGVKTVLKQSNHAPKIFLSKTA
ncbi:MAG: hypothetical protein Q7V63_00355 [Gammaproteobacteria bacterium]|nr:hypothetical protein [Gammaproteobacteria bacterium]